METFAQTTNFIELSKAVGIVIAATAAAIVVFMKAWAAIKGPKEEGSCVDCRNKVAAIYRVLNEVKDFLNKEDPTADRPRVYTPKNMEESLKCIKENMRVLEDHSKRIEGMVDDIHGKSNVWDANTGA